MHPSCKWNDSYIGKQFGYLTILGLSSKRGNSGEIKVICQCICGKIIEPNFYFLRTEKQIDCGCVSRSIAAKTHGYSKTKLYWVWCSMKYRCINPKHKSYKDYGGRGITVCNEWLNDFLIFRFQMRKKYLNAKSKYKGKQITIERIDNNKGYYYHNCTFIPKELQAKNRRNVHPIKAIHRKTGEEVYGKNKTELAKKINISDSFICSILHNRYKSKKWIIRPILTSKKRKE
jgi:hypothetical protein